MAAAVSQPRRAGSSPRPRKARRRRQGLEGQEMRRDERGERHRDREAQCFDMAAAGAQPGHRRPQKRTRTSGRARGSGRSSSPPSPSAGRGRRAAWRQGADRDADGQDVEVRRAHPVGQGEIACDGEDHAAQDVEEALGGLGRERGPDQRQGAPDEHQGAGKACPGEHEPAQALLRRPVAAVEERREDEKDDPERHQHDDAAPGE